MCENVALVGTAAFIIIVETVLEQQMALLAHNLLQWS